MKGWHEKLQSQEAQNYIRVKSHGQKSLAGYGAWGRLKVRHNLVTKQQQKAC